MNSLIESLVDELPEAGEPFPKRELWLAAFRAVLDLVYDVEPAAGSLICPLCGGPKSRYATACIKHNAGNPGNQGGPGGDRSSPAALAAGVGKPRVAVVEIDARNLAPEQRQQFSQALANKDGVGAVRAVASNGQPKKACQGAHGDPCPKQAQIMPQSDHCQTCNQAARRPPRGIQSGVKLVAKYPGRPPSAMPDRRGLETTLTECPCVNPERANRQAKAPLGIMVRGYGDAAESFACRLFREPAAVS